MKWTFYLYSADISTRSYPRHEFVDAATRKEALAEFCRRHKLKVSEDEREVVWFLGLDGEALEYSVSIYE